MKQHKIPSHYKTGKIVPDYYPLSEAEVLELLLTARRCLTYEDDYVATMEIASIQCRLDQGIVGQVNPPRSAGVVAEKQYQIDDLYVDFVKHPDVGDDDIKNLANAVWKLMQ